MIVYKAVSENLTQLGGPMGTERTWYNWISFHQTKEGAMKKCEKDYKKHGKLKWAPVPGQRGAVTTGDLRFVMYTVRPVRVLK